MWTVKAQFDFRSRGGRVKVTMSARSKIERFNEGTGSLVEFIMLTSTWPDVIVIILGTVFSFQSAKALLAETRMHINALAPEERHLSRNWHWFLDVLAWDHLIHVISGGFNVCFSTYDLSTTDYGGDLQVGRILLGVSVFLSFVSLSFHLRWFPKYFILASALQKGLAPVARLLIGIMPIFMAFVFISMVWFGMYCEHFSTFHESVTTLFCILNGDVMRDTFNEINVDDPLRGFLGSVVLFGFCMLFMYVVLSVFVVILEDAYFMVRCDMMKEAAEDDEGLTALDGVKRAFYRTALQHMTEAPPRNSSTAPLPDAFLEFLSLEERCSRQLEARRQRESLRLRPTRNYGTATALPETPLYGSTNDPLATPR